MKTENIAAITMVYGSAFLEKWISHYSAQFGSSNLFVISHGYDEEHVNLCSNVNHMTIPRVFDERFEKSRINLINNMANGLLSAYRAVVFTDVDEMICIDPKLDTSLADYIRESEAPVLAPIGLNVLPENTEHTIKWSEGLLSQTRKVVYAPRFCKPCIRKTVAKQGAGGHALFNRTFEVDENILLFHLKYIDTKIGGRYRKLGDASTWVAKPEVHAEVRVTS
jgi:hypothetical protein